MIKSPLFEVSIQPPHSLIIPDNIALPFVNAGHDRIRAEARYGHNHIVFHAALQTDRNGLYRITFGKRLQKALNVFVNDYFNLQLFEDESRYGVEIPEELEAVLSSDPDAFLRFEDLTPGRQRSLIYSILRYKNSQTRIDKSLLMCENLKRGITDLKMIFKA